MLGIIAGILVARDLKTTEDLFDTKPSPRTESLVACAVQWAERIMRKVDLQCENPVSQPLSDETPFTRLDPGRCPPRVIVSG